MMPSYLERDGQPRLAFHASAGNPALPTVIFLGGFRSDMNGTKARFLEDQCRARGQAYVRFDYRGHGESGGVFADGNISRWREDALAVLDRVAPGGPVILAGSSMGGWIALLLAQARPLRVRGLVGIAAAPDFTREFPARFTPDMRTLFAAQGYIDITGDYSPESYRITREFFEDAEQWCLFDAPLQLDLKVRLVQGMQDPDVPWQTAFRIKKALTAATVDVMLIEHGDHRLSRPEDLALIDSQVQEISALICACT